MMKNAWLIGLLACVSGWSLAAEDPFTVAVTLSPVAGEAPRLSVSMGVPEGHYLYDDMFSVEAAPPATLTPESLTAPEMHYDSVTETNRAVYAHPFVQTYRVSGGVGETLSVTVNFQGCAGDLCYLPMTKTFTLPLSGGTVTGEEPGVGKPVTSDGEVPLTVTPAGFHVRARTEGYLKTDAFLAFLKGDVATAGTGPAWLRWIAGGGVLGILIILLGGLALNLTPCVLPMIPINLAIIGAGSKAGSHLRGLALGSLYGLGMAVAYGLLGIVVVLTGAVFGTLNASPWFNLVFALLFIFLALAMFGVFNIDLSRFQPSNVPGGTGQKGAMAFPLAFVLGALSALLAGACVAPVVVAVLAHAADLYAAGSRAGLFLPLVLGVGMALPWPFAGAGMAVLPKPGRWMEWVKYAMGVVIVLLALNYAWNAWNGFRWTRGQTDSRAALAQGLKEAASTGKPVFIDFWATWCKSCRTMDETTFQDESVKKALEAFVVVKFQAEQPADPETKAVLDAYGVHGLPTYVVLEKGE
jgi:thiol:disulfide interchange protein